jgi:hypothetical protein
MSARYAIAEIPRRIRNGEGGKGADGLLGLPLHINKRRELTRQKIGESWSIWYNDGDSHQYF